MDFRTKPITRQVLRDIANDFRKIFRYKDDECIDVIKILELVGHVFKRGEISFIILDDNDPIFKGCPATTVPDMKGNYCIYIKESVYESAYFRDIGGYRGHIMHEICHVILFMLGFTPCIDKTFKNQELKCYESVEWQAKALAGEILMPYEATKYLSVEEIQKKHKVSQEAAEYRFNQKK